MGIDTFVSGIKFLNNLKQLVKLVCGVPPVKKTPLNLK